MSMVEEVFGVSNNIIESCIERQDVGGEFQNALNLKKQIVVYGSSKQGKSPLTKKHLNSESTVMVQSSPSATLIDIYSAILLQCDIQIQTESYEQKTKHGEAGGPFKAKLKIPFFVETEAGVSGKGGIGSTKTKSYRDVKYNLALAQDISKILRV